MSLPLVACAAEENRAENRAVSEVLAEIPLIATPIERGNHARVTSYADIIEAATPAVVSVHTARVVQIVRGSRNPHEEMLRRFFGIPAPQQPGEPPVVEERRQPSGVGSGVIVSRDGLILTNNHVITGQQDSVADEILVRLNDGRELPARVVGRDPRTDLAVLQVDAEDLPTLPVADSNHLRVGDIVFAIGNPMSLGTTVTMGIVSATGRSGLNILGRDGFENFIQTDASINPGNSGGALIDAEGRLVGINTAIISRTGGNMGIGFAVPSTMAHSVLVSLVTTGRVQRGFLGVNISDLNADMAEAFGTTETQGALIQEVVEDMPAALAGLRRGDIIVRFNNMRVRNANDLRLAVGQTPPGTSAAVEIIRRGESMTLTVNLSDSDEAEALASSGEWVTGVEIANLDTTTREAHNIPANVNGVIITQVASNSPHARVLRPGMVVIEINDRPATSVNEARQLLRRGANKLYVFQRGSFGYLAIRVN